jgi:hypothetical protein
MRETAGAIVEGYRTVISGVRQAAISPPRQARAAGRLRLLLTCTAALLALPVAGHAQQAPDLPLPRNTLGTVGVIDMPSARMDDDGTLSIGASYMKNIQRYNLGFQALPWLEASFRYSGLANFSPGYPVYWDRSFGLKMRLFEEGDLMPALAVGINDIIGTGLYSGEYLVASKQFGDFDAALGMGWGRYGGNNTFANPVGLIAPSFKNPRPGLSTPGGTPFDSFFHGPTAGVFGGINWRTPLEGLTLSIENSSDRYSFERQQNTFTPHSRWNYGASYRITDTTLISASYLYGNSFAGGVTFELDPTRPQYQSTIGEVVPPPVIRSQEAQRDALRILTGQRDPQYTTGRVRSENRNSFVDGLLATPGVGDVLITGNVLHVTMTNMSGAEALCRAAARNAAGSDTGIAEVAVYTSRGVTAARCGVPRLLQAAMHFSDFTHPEALMLDGKPMLIDATDVQPPADRAAAERKFRGDAKKQVLQIRAMVFTETEATVYFENFHYQHEDEAVERMTRLLMADAPSTIEKFRIISVKNGIPQREFHILRMPAERALDNDQENPTIFNSPVSIQSPPLDNPILERRRRALYPHFDWDVFPQFRQQFFDPNNPLGVQLVGTLAGSLELAPGLMLYGEGEVNLFDTFNTARSSDSVLPHVRTDFVRYFSEGKNGIGALELNYRTRLTPEFYATFKAGYLESMFTGVGGEVLYRPDGARWAIGADMYEVWQRNFDRLFGLQNYRVATGHVTLYWDSPFYDLNVQVRAGQYLAGDRGLTLQITRRFSTGVEIGAFVTKTNVSAQTFGEGSFDKGIVIRIPLGWVAPIDTQNLIGLDLRPVQRDGGQPLQGDATLYEETRRASESEMVRNGKSFSDRE